MIFCETMSCLFASTAMWWAFDPIGEGMRERIELEMSRSGYIPVFGSVEPDGGLVLMYCLYARTWPAD